MNDPIAFFITIATYGTWLPGDERGWIEYQHGWQLPDPVRKVEAKAKMSEDACVLTRAQRDAAEEQVMETCSVRNWLLHEVNCRTNHIHVVVTAQHTHPKKVRADLKAWCTRKLRQLPMESRQNWLADRGSIRWIFNEEQLLRVIAYVRDGQDRKHLDR